jgi:uncharacterized protein
MSDAAPPGTDAVTGTSEGRSFELRMSNVEFPPPDTGVRRRGAQASPTGRRGAHPGALGCPSAGSDAGAPSGDAGVVRRLATRVLLCALALAAPAFAREVPYLSGRINDTANMIPPEVAERLDSQLGRLEADTGAQVAVLTIDSLDGEDLEGYSLKVAQTWALGRKGVDDGALLLISRDDRKMRIEVGYGLEPTLTDIASKRILDDVIRPRFRAGDFGGGIEAGVGAIDGTVRGQDVLPPPSASSSGSSMPMPFVAKLGFFAFFLLIVGIFSLTAIATKGCGGWFLFLFLIPFWTAFPMAIWGAPGGVVFPIAWVVGFPLLWFFLNKSKGGTRFRKQHHWVETLNSSRGGGWSSSGGGSSGGGSSGGGGFSGGGGSFGGGGASSGW